MHNPAPVLENNTYKLLWDFDIHTDNLISARRPDITIINKKKENLSTLLSRLTTEWNWKKVKRRISTSTLLENWKKQTIEHEGDDYSNCDWCFVTVIKGLSEGTGGLGSWCLSGLYPNDSFIENGQNIEESPRDLRGLLSLKLQWKTISWRWCEKP